MPDGRTTGGRTPDGCTFDGGSITLETVLVMPVLLMAVLAVLAVVGVVRDALLAHEAARAGVRAAATSSGTAEVVAVVEEAMAGRPHRVRVMPTWRRAGQLVTVEVQVLTRLGPFERWLSASLVAEVEPLVDR